MRILLGLLVASALGLAESRGSQDLDARVREGAANLASLIEVDSPQWEEVKELSLSLLTDVRKLAEILRRESSGRHPAVEEWLKSRDEAPGVELRDAPLVLFGAATPEDVRAGWRGQLRACAKAIRGLLGNDREMVQDWLYWQDREGPRKEGQPFFIFEQIRDCVREIRKLADLLTLPTRIIRIKRGRTLFRDDGMREGDWKAFGAADISRQGSSLRIKGEGNTIWCDQEFEEAVVSFDFTPLAGKGGVLFAFPASPLSGKSLDASAGKMENYNLGIETYHVSLCRGSSGRSHLRRTGRGLKMLSRFDPDPCARLGQKYNVEMLSYRGTIQVHVDGKLIHTYLDAGVYGPAIRKGRFGIRHFSGEPLECLYENFQASALE